MKMCRGVRGATTAKENSRKDILARTQELLVEMVKANEIEPGDITSIIFTTTRDLNAEYPAVAARQLGWYDQALLCAHEMDVPHGLPKCIRILLQWNTRKEIQEINHVYINGAESLRPDRTVSSEIA